MLVLVYTQKKSPAAYFQAHNFELGTPGTGFRQDQNLGTGFVGTGFPKVPKILWGYQIFENLFGLFDSKTLVEPRGLATSGAFFRHYSPMSWNSELNPASKKNMRS